MTGTGAPRRLRGVCGLYRSIGRWPLGEHVLPADFREFLKLLNEAEVQYLLIGGYAVGYHGYPRTTADMDVWVAISADNAAKLVDVFRNFGMQDSKLTPELFLQRGKIIRVGVPPMRIEVLTEIDGVAFSDCFAAREVVILDGQKVNLISLADLRKNKLASGRHKDLDDLEHLPKRRTTASRIRRVPRRS
jgi:predicted nucleotidyltransferase